MQRFRWHAVQALMADARQDATVARAEASAALAAAASSESGLRYHQALGLVRDVARDLEERLRRLAGA